MHHVCGRRFDRGWEHERTHRASSVYLILQGVVQCAEREGLRYLGPLISLIRARGVAIIARTARVVESL